MIQEEKRVRFVVVNGLAIVEKPTSLCIDDAEWYVKLSILNIEVWFIFIYLEFCPSLYLGLS